MDSTKDSNKLLDLVRDNLVRAAETYRELLKEEQAAGQDKSKLARIAVAKLRNDEQARLFLEPIIGECPKSAEMYYQRFYESGKLDGHSQGQGALSH